MAVGCAIKTPILNSQSYVVTIKMKGIAFNDMGFLNYGKNFTDVQLFSLGTLIFELKINNYISINSHSFTNKEFNKRFLSSNYPAHILEHILNKKPIFLKENYERKKDGFEQIIKKKNISIKYFVSNNEIYFKDNKNHILIKLKKLENK